MLAEYISKRHYAVPWLGIQLIPTYTYHKMGSLTHRKKDRLSKQERNPHVDCATERGQQSGKGVYHKRGKRSKIPFKNDDMRLLFGCCPAAPDVSEMFRKDHQQWRLDGPLKGEMYVWNVPSGSPGWSVRVATVGRRFEDRGGINGAQKGGLWHLKRLANLTLLQSPQTNPSQIMDDPRPLFSQKIKALGGGCFMREVFYFPSFFPYSSRK